MTSLAVGARSRWGTLRTFLDAYIFWVTALSLLIVLGVKFAKNWEKPAAMLLSTWCFEACTALSIVVLVSAIAQVPWFTKLHLSKVVFVPWHALHFTSTFFAAYYLGEAARRKFSLLDTGWEALHYLLDTVVPWEGLALYGVALLTPFGVALLLRRVPIPGRPVPVLAVLLASWTAIGFTARAADKFPTPFWDLAVDMVEIANHPWIVPFGGEVPPDSAATLDAAEREIPRVETPFKKVLVFVMEEITLRDFLDSRAQLSPLSFFNRVEPQARFYRNVFTSNMDSRTGTLALLGSRFIPYEAYSPLAVPRYTFLKDMPSLVDVMRNNGYFTAYATSQVVPEPIVKDLPWDQRHFLTEPQTAAYRANGTPLCFRPYRFEDSCEDKFMLAKLFEHLDREDKLFWFQSLVWGHTVYYRNATHKTDVEYYGEMLDLLVADLERRGQLEETLIVVTSDHGMRDKEARLAPSSYRIPLLFYAPSLAPLDSAALYSQIDFKDLLLAALTSDASRVRDNAFTLFMGPSYSSLVGAVTKDLDFMVIKNRAWAKYVLELSNVADGDDTDAPPRGAGTPEEFLAVLEDYRRHFQSLAK